MDIHESNGDMRVVTESENRLEELSEKLPHERPPFPPEPELITGLSDHQDASGYATRADLRGKPGMEKIKVILLGSGLLVAVLFFVFTAIIGRLPSKAKTAEPPSSQQAREQKNDQPKGSVTPLMETVRKPNPDNADGQLGPGDIKRTRTADGSQNTGSTIGIGQRPTKSPPGASGSLASVPSFSDTQQKWEEPRPYGGPAEASPAQTQQQQNALKEPSLVFVKSQTQNQAAGLVKDARSGEDAPALEMTPGTRIQAKLETQISSAVSAPVVAVVEYTYAIGDQVVIPAGARMYGQLQQADRSGYVGVKFDELELLDGAREKIDAIGTGLDLGPIRGNVFGKNTGKNFLVRAASGLGSVLAEIAGNNSSAAFSEGDMLRERLAENIGTAGNSEVMSLNANSSVVVSVPADTKIYIVFTKREQNPSTLHKVSQPAQ